MVDSRSLRRDPGERTPTQTIVVSGTPIVSDTWLAGVGTLTPGQAAMAINSTQVTQAPAGNVCLGWVDVDLTGYSACKTIGGTYTTGDPVRIVAGDIKLKAFLTTGAGATLTAGQLLKLGGAGDLASCGAPTATSTDAVHNALPVAKLMEEYATANAVTAVIVQSLI
jgi:hypothetical protein